jgi:hypothetical protein
MFISEQTANERLNSSRNVLTRVNKEESIDKGVPHTLEPPSIETVEPSQPEEIPREDQACRSAIGIINPDMLLIKKMLGLAPQGRKQGVKNAPVEIQAAAATTAQLVSTRVAAREFDFSHHHAHELKHGYTNQEAQYNPGVEPNALLRQEVNHQKKMVRDLAFEKLVKTLGLLDDDKLAALTDPVKIARVGRDLSTIHEKALPREEQNTNSGVHFHIWKPEQREEDSYPMVRVGASSTVPATT